MDRMEKGTKEIIKRTIFCILGLFIAGIGVVLLGIIIMGLGISISVIADLILNSGEAFVKAVADTTHKEFGNLKIGFDVSCMMLSVVLSLIFFDFRIVGTREGTVIAALLTGFVIRFFTKRIRVPLEKIIVGY